MLQSSFDFDRSKPRKDGTLPLKVKIYRSRTDYIFVGLKIYLLPAQWDGKKIVNSVTAAIDNARLNNYRVSIGKVLFEIDESDETPPMSEIRDRIQVALGQKQQKSDTFYGYFKQYSSGVTGQRTREAFTSTLKKVLKYDEIDKPFEQITAGWLRGFELFCRNDGLAVNSISIHLRNIRTIYNRAIDDGVAQLNDYPFRRFKIKQERTRKRALSVEQLRALRDYPCTESQRQYRDIFMLIFYLGGINLVDLFRLTNIENGYIHYSRSKTHVPYQIKIEPEAMEIIERYRGNAHLLSAADRYKDHQDFTRRINRALQSIGAPAAKKTDTTKPGPAPVDRKKGAFPELSSYTGRHMISSYQLITNELQARNYRQVTI